MSDKIVMITDQNDVCYGMLGKVIGEDSRDGRVIDRYHIMITGYENCIKAGYEDKFIREHNLNTLGFYRIIDNTRCKVMTDKEIEVIVKLSPDTSVDKEMAVVYMNEIVTIDDLMQFPLSHCLNGENVDKAAVEAYKVRTAELLGVNLIQSTQWKERLEKAQQMENAEFLKLVDKEKAKEWYKDVLDSSAFAKYEPTKNEEDFER